MKVTSQRILTISKPQSPNVSCICLQSRPISPNVVFKSVVMLKQRSGLPGWQSDRMTGWLTEWQDDRLTGWRMTDDGWQDDRMIDDGWQDDRWWMTGWRMMDERMTDDRMNLWQDDRMNLWLDDRWLDVQMTGCPDDKMTGSFADDWPYGIFSR